MELLAARTLSVADYGTYAGGLAVTVVSAGLLTFGIPELGLRTIANSTSSSERAQALNTYNALITLLLMLAGTVSAASLYFTRDTGMNIVIPFVTSASCFLATSAISTGILRALHRIRSAIIIERLAFDLTSLAIAVVLLGTLATLTLFDFMAITVAATFSSATFGITCAWWKKIPTFRVSLEAVLQLVLTGVPLGLATNLRMLFLRIDVIILTLLGQSVIVGSVSPVLRLGEFVAFCAIATVPSLVPSIAQAVGMRDPHEVNRRVRLASRIAWISGGLIAAGLMILSDSILGAFGDIYRSLRLELFLVLVAQVVVLLASPAAEYLTVTGRVKHVYICYAAAITAKVVALWMIPAISVTAVAISVLASSAVLHLALAILSTRPGGPAFGVLKILKNARRDA